MVRVYNYMGFGARSVGYHGLRSVHLLRTGQPAFRNPGGPRRRPEANALWLASKISPERGAAPVTSNRARVADKACSDDGRHFVLLMGHGKVPAFCWLGPAGN